MRILRPKKHPWKGLAAGAVGGLVASWAMSRFHALVSPPAPPQTPAPPDATVLAAAQLSRAVFHHELTPREEKLAGPVMHYGFGTLMGGIHGLGAGLLPRVPTGFGLPLGAALYFGAHAVAVPALGLAESPARKPPAAEAPEFAAHLVYGAVADAVRRAVGHLL